MVETEIWPNILRECRRRGVKTVLVNGRISYRSFPRYRLVRPFFRRVLADIDRFCVQGDETARRLVALGADPARVDRKSTRLNSSHANISYAVFCLKKKKTRGL